jgi:peptidoglycan/xylan/chitin deacetylase (PgdA/CDA1 family)
MTDTPITTPLAPRRDPGHVPWSPLPTRQQLRWPDGAHVALVVLVHLEHVEWLPPPGTTVPRSVVNRGPYPVLPDAHEVTPHEYGNRVGIFRVMEVLDSLGIRATAAVDAEIARNYPYLVEQCLSREWELIGHAPTGSRLNSELLSERQEREYLEFSLDAVRDAQGTAVRGWAGLDYGESSRTVRLLSELGVDYVCDWPNDEQPYEFDLPSARMTSLPVSIHLDDLHAHKRGVPVMRWSQMITEGFDRLVVDGADQGRLLVLGVHPWITGQPFRIGHLRRALAHVIAAGNTWAATGAEVVDWHRAQSTAPQGGAR